MIKHCHRNNLHKIHRFFYLNYLHTLDHTSQGWTGKIFFFTGRGRAGRGKAKNLQGGAGNTPLPTVRGGAGKGSKSAGQGGARAGNKLRA